MIEGYCHTHLDDYKRAEWPTVFAALPRVGDAVESLDGRHRLRVVDVTHQVVRRGTVDVATGEKTPTRIVPIIKVELHKRCVP